jgi:hypothetical protein
MHVWQSIVTMGHNGTTRDTTPLWNLWSADDFPRDIVLMIHEDTFALLDIRIILAMLYKQKAPKLKLQKVQPIHNIQSDHLLVQSYQG